MVEDYRWHLVDAFFKANPVSQQQINSFNEFIDTTIQEIIDENRILTLTSITPNHQIVKTNLTFGKCYIVRK
jgi:DNA-directed RNA polymerase II subunit RPB2